jgi:hypothetical protein
LNEVASPVKKTEMNGRGDPLRWPRSTLCEHNFSGKRQLLGHIVRILININRVYYLYTYKGVLRGWTLEVNGGMLLASRFGRFTHKK